MNRWVRRNHATGTTDPLPHGGGHPLRTDDGVVAQLVEAAPDRTRADVAAAYAKVTGVPLSVPSIGPALQRLGCVGARGERVYGRVPHNRGKVRAMSQRAIDASMSTGPASGYGFSSIPMR